MMMTEGAPDIIVEATGNRNDHEDAMTVRGELYREDGLVKLTIAGKNHTGSTWISREAWDKLVSAMT
jgi:hypothetical protein